MADGCSPPDRHGASAHAQVLVVGAGPVGLMLGVGLSLHGVDVLVVDRADPGRHAPRAAVVWPREAEALAAYGLGEALCAASLALSTAHIHAGGERLGALSFGDLESAFPQPLVIEQHAVERLLLARYLELGGRVSWRTAVADLQIYGDGVEARLDGGGRVSADWVVGCDGASSLVRKRMGARFAGAPVKNLECVQINGRPRWAHDAPPGEGRFFLAPGAAVGCFPTADGHWRFYCFKVDDRPDRTGPPDAEEMSELLTRLTSSPVEVEPAEPAWFNRARFQRRTATKFCEGRALLCGDAAHVWPAVGGHGMAAGLLGAHNLAWKLAAVMRRGADVALLDTYAQEQRRTARAIRGHMRLDLLEAPQPPAVFAVMRRLLPALLPNRAVGRRLEAMLGDMTLHHRGSALSRGAGGPVAAGDRLPDPVLEHGRLHARLDPLGWTLVGEAGPALETAAAAVGAHVAALEPQDAAVVRRLGLARRQLLVRPDGYVALVLRPGDGEFARRHLARFGLQRVEAERHMGATPKAQTRAAA